MELSTVEHRRGGFVISTDPKRLDLDVIHGFLRNCYWAKGIPREVAALITQEIEIPTIGIGAGPDCDGQVLVFSDLVGLTEGHTPKFARRYAELAETIRGAVGRFVDDVQKGAFPSDSESYHLPAAARDGVHAKNT
jgi:3-methyl-2-oxobutanoate hydroxymethyltransferase